MNITTVPFALLSFQYRIARYPLQLIEERVMARMGAETPARLFYERSLGLLDAAVGSALGDSKLKERGSALAERSDTLSRAARLDAAASEKEMNAEAELNDKRDKAIDDQTQARETRQRDIEDARTRAEHRKGAATANADKRAEAAKQKADEVAVKRANAVEDAKRTAQAGIRAEQNEATAAAQSKLEASQAKSGEVESKRALADRLEHLADAEKHKRQSARAAKN